MHFVFCQQNCISQGSMPLVPEHFASWVNNSADNILKYFANSLQENGFNISYKLSPKKTGGMGCQTYFLKKKKKKVPTILSAELAQRKQELK